MPGNFASAGLRCSWTVDVPGRWVSWVVHIQCREFLGNTTSWENVWRSGTMRWQMIIHDESEVQDIVWGKWWHVCCILVPWNGRNKCSLWCHLFSSSMHALFSLRSFWKNLLHSLVYFMRYLCSWNRVFQRLGGHAWTALKYNTHSNYIISNCQISGRWVYNFKNICKQQLKKQPT